MTTPAPTPAPTPAASFGQDARRIERLQRLVNAQSVYCLARFRDGAVSPGHVRELHAAIDDCSQHGDLPPLQMVEEAERRIAGDQASPGAAEGTG